MAQNQVSEAALGDIQEESAAAAPGVSGRKLTIVLLAALTLVGVALSYVLWSYNRVDDSRDQVVDAWNILFEELATRYRAVEKQVATGVDAQEMEMALGERFRLAIDQFRSTAQADVQLSAAMELEAIMKAANLQPPLSASLQEAAEKYNQCVLELAQLLDTPGGQTLLLFLNLNPVEEFHPAPSD